jgi:hypothetical protein
VYEGSRPSVVDKPLPHASRQQKDEYIHLKYVQRAFLNKQVLLEAAELGERKLQLAESAAVGQLDRLQHLLALGADVNWANPNDSDNTALHHSAANAHALCVEFLCQNNASLEAVNALGQTPQDVATLNGHTKVIFTSSAHRHTTIPSTPPPS